jgi:hypothetical protein
MVLAALLGLGACASDGSEPVHSAIQASAARATLGVQKVHHALEHPSQASAELGEGIQAVEAATRDLAVLEDDARASELQRLMAVVGQARAWDDLSTAFDIAAAPDLDPPQQVALASVLRDKAFPARVAAEAAFRRALRTACRLGLEEQPVVSEIMDGIARFGQAPAKPCE